MNCVALSGMDVPSMFAGTFMPQFSSVGNKEKAPACQVVLDVFKGYGIYKENDVNDHLAYNVDFIELYCRYSMNWDKYQKQGLSVMQKENHKLDVVARLGEAREDLYTLSDTESHHVNGTALVFGEQLNSLTSSHHCESWKGLLLHMWNIVCLKHPKRSGIIMQGPQNSGKSALVKLLSSPYDLHEIRYFKTVDKMGQLHVGSVHVY